MKELNDIIIAYDKAVSQNKQTVLATVVKVIGSSYRRPGAEETIGALFPQVLHVFKIKVGMRH